LLERQRVRRDQEVLILPVGEGLDRQGQALPELPGRRRALVAMPGDQRGHAVRQQRRPPFAQIAIRAGVVEAQLGQRVVPLAQPVPQHRRSSPCRAIRTPGSLGELAGLPQG
jgi:hypothetical protein